MRICGKCGMTTSPERPRSLAGGHASRGTATIACPSCDHGPPPHPPARLCMGRWCIHTDCVWSRVGPNDASRLHRRPRPMPWTDSRDVSMERLSVPTRSRAHPGVAAATYLRRRASPVVPYGRAGRRFGVRTQSPARNDHRAARWRPVRFGRPERRASRRRRWPKPHACACPSRCALIHAPCPRKIRS